MKKTLTMICIILIISLITINLKYIYHKNITKNVPEEKTGLPLALMVETEIDSEEYKSWESEDWPGVGYVFNKEKSKCANGNTINYDERTKQIIMNGINADRCYVYFDKIQTVYNYNYTGDSQEFITPITGEYKIELWGASGGSASNYKPGNGAYTTGTIDLIEKEILYVYVGESGKSSILVDAYKETFNGGGGLGFINNDNTSQNWGGSGGGATDIRFTNGDWNDFDSLKTRIMVAAGGGGAASRGENHGDGNGGAGGTLTGIDGENVNYSAMFYGYGKGYGATQTEAGKATWFKGSEMPVPNNYNPDINVGGFGYAGIIWGIDCYSSVCEERNNLNWAPWGNQTGGGGGYYGGGSVLHGGAGGGSSFISGYPGCDAILESSTEDHIIHTGQPIHYSQKIFTDAYMIAGDSSMPNPTGGTETGHLGNGYAKITLIG